MSSGRWFRFYDDALNDPKVQMLSGETFKLWMNVLCVASKNGGVLPDLECLAYALRMQVAGASEAVDRLARGGLLDRVNATHWAPHGWKKRQYKSDSSTERVKRFRNVSETPQNRADTDTDTEKKVSMPRKRGRPKVPIPENWHPTEVLSSDDLFELERFKNHARANDRRCANWSAAWSNWKTSPYRKSGASNGRANGADRQERHSLRAAFDKLDAALDEQIRGGQKEASGEAEVGDLPFPSNLRLLSGGSV
jgi:hypothetical protein